MDSPSAVVQAALSRFAGGGRGTTEYAVRPELNGELSAALEAARAHIVSEASEARELYQHGYREGLDLAGKLDFRQLAYIVRVGAKEAAQNQASVAFDFDTGRLDRATHGGPLIEPRELIGYLGSYADYTGGEFPTPAAPTIEGIDRALADVWDAVHGAHLDGEEMPTEPSE